MELKKDDICNILINIKCCKFDKNNCMKVFKFGGASVMNAESVRNIGNILRNYNEPLVVVISAMGKTTNALERVVNAQINGDKTRACEELDRIRDYHMSIVEG